MTLIRAAKRADRPIAVPTYKVDPEAVDLCTLNAMRRFVTVVPILASPQHMADLCESLSIRPITRLEMQADSCDEDQLADIGFFLVGLDDCWIAKP